MKTRCKPVNLIYILTSVFLFYAQESLADIDKNAYLMFVESNAGNGYHGNLITSDDPTATAANISNIDKLCNKAGNTTDPSGFNRSYKAMISSSYRYTDSTISNDWVLQPDTEYYNRDTDAMIGTTDDIETFDLKADSFTGFSDINSRVWTGLNTDWSIADNSCQQWTNKNGDKNGRVGVANYSDSGAISEEGKHCDGHGYLYCVMQPTTTMLSPSPGGTLSADAVLPIKIQFNNASGVNPSSVSTNTFTVVEASSNIPLSGTVSNLTESVYQFTPSVRLTAGSQYIVVVSGVKDKSDHLIPNAKFRFLAKTSPFILFVSTNSWYGHEVNDISGADSKCQTEAYELKLDGTYKAMLLGDTRTTTSDWVLKPNTEYFNLYGESIGTTNSSALFGDDLTSNIYEKNHNTYKRVWTGMSSVWARDSDTCDSWRSGGNYGRYGTSKSLIIAEVISYHSEYCQKQEGNYRQSQPFSTQSLIPGSKSGSKGHLYCVKQ